MPNTLKMINDPHASAMTTVLTHVEEEPFNWRLSKAEAYITAERTWMRITGILHPKIGEDDLKPWPIAGYEVQSPQGTRLVSISGRE